MRPNGLLGLARALVRRTGLCVCLLRILGGRLQNRRGRRGTLCMHHMLLMMDLLLLRVHDMCATGAIWVYIVIRACIQWLVELRQLVRNELLIRCRPLGLDRVSSH